jgi:hypothetical protein
MSAGGENLMNPTKQEGNFMAYVLEPMTSDALSRIFADAKTSPGIDEALQREFQDGIPPHRRWAVDRENDSYLFWFGEISDTKLSRSGFLFFYRGKAFVVYMCTSACVYGKSSHDPGGMEGWVSQARDFSTPPPQDPDFQQAFSEAYDVLGQGRALFKPVFRVDLTKSYALEPITSDDLTRILADAETSPDTDKALRRRGLTGDIRIGRKWAIDRDNNSYLLWCGELTNARVYREGYMFFFRNQAFGVYMYMSNHVSGKNNRVPNGRVGWVSLARDFSALPPKDPDFQEAFSEAYEVLQGKLWPKPVFGSEQQDKELAT